MWLYYYFYFILFKISNILSGCYMPQVRTGARSPMVVDAWRLMPWLLNCARRNTLQVHEHWWRCCVASQILVSLIVKEKNRGRWWLRECRSMVREDLITSSDVVVGAWMNKCGGWSSVGTTTSWKWRIGFHVWDGERWWRGSVWLASLVSGGSWHVSSCGWTDLEGEDCYIAWSGWVGFKW